MSDIEILSGGTKVFLSGEHRFSRDSLLLADFVNIKKNSSLLDIGAGCGIVSLALWDRGFSGETLALEIDPEACALAERAAAENGFSSYRAQKEDLRNFKPQYKFDCAVCNPPYFKAGAGTLSKSEARRAARSESLCGIADIALCARRSLKEGGSLFLCYRPERLAYLICELEAGGFAAKRLRLVRHSREEEPWLALLEARPGGGEGLKIMQDLID
ncbi:MAG: methyltransferase [Oscillospiraceae bacterium]|nr:methyltransferase [Oscillospiraceae bacterium]